MFAPPAAQLVRQTKKFDREYEERKKERKKKKQFAVAREKTNNDTVKTTLRMR